MHKALPLEVDLKPGTPLPRVRVSVGRSYLASFWLPVLDMASLHRHHERLL